MSDFGIWEILGLVVLGCIIYGINEYVVSRPSEKVIEKEKEEGKDP